jgi:hypothetical protein
LETNVDERIHSHNAPVEGKAGTAPGEPAPMKPDAFPGVVQGLASVLIAMTFILGGPGSMQVIWILWDSHFRDFTKIEILLVAICGFAGCLIILTAAVFGLIFGILSVNTARQHNRPAALGHAGAMLNTFCIMLWIFIAVLWAFAIGSRI